MLHIKAFFDPATFTVSYVVHPDGSRECAVIDAVLDFDPKSGVIRHTSVDALLAYLQHEHLHVRWILETHAHADHLSGAQVLKRQTGGDVVIGALVTRVQAHFAPVFNLGDDFARDGRQFDRLVHEGEQLPLGDTVIEVMHTPGHTEACVSYRIDDAVFVGDTLFMPDYGTARTDFPGGDARALFHSIRRLLSLPDSTRLFMCHDYLPGGREPRWETTVGEERCHNLIAHDGISEETFVSERKARDAQLAAPVLLLPSIQVNINAGHLPEPAANGVRYLSIPLRGSI